MSNIIDDSKASKFYVPLASGNYGSVEYGENVMLRHYYNKILDIEKEKTIEDQYALVNSVLNSVERQPDKSCFIYTTCGPKGGDVRTKITKEGLLEFIKEIKSSIDEKYNQYLNKMNKKDDMIKQLLDIEEKLDTTKNFKLNDLEEIKETLHNLYYLSIITFDSKDKFLINGKNFTVNKFRGYISDLDDIASEKIQELTGANTPQ